MLDGGRDKRERIGNFERARGPKALRSCWGAIMPDPTGGMGGCNTIPKPWIEGLGPLIGEWRLVTIAWGINIAGAYRWDNM